MSDWFGAVSAFAREITIFQRGRAGKSRAFIQPLSAVSPERAGTATPAGVCDGRRYLIIAAADAFEGGAGAVVECAGRKYELLRWEKMGGGSHCEGIMRLMAGDCDDA